MSDSRGDRVRTAVTNPPGTHLYAYCAVRGALGARAVAKLPSLPGGSAPRVLPLTGDISLVVADVPADAYRADAIEARLSDLDWVSRCGAAHHAVVDALAPKHTVVPFRLFTLFTNEERVLKSLGRATGRIDEALDRVRGRAEWVLRISKPAAAGPGEDAASAGGAAKRSRQRPASGSRHAAVRPGSGAAFLAQKAASKKAAADLAARVRSEAAAVFDTLAALADDANERSLEAPAALLLDAAFLVPVRQTAAFKRALEKSAASLLNAGCRVSLTGPWPPYSFVALEPTSRRG